MSLDNIETKRSDRLFRHANLVGGVLKTIAECEDSHEIDSVKIEKLNGILDASSYEQLIDNITASEDLNDDIFVKWFSSDLVDIIASLRKIRLNFRCQSTDYEFLKALSSKIVLSKYSIDSLVAFFKQYPMSQKANETGRNCIIHALIHIANDMDEVDKVLELEPILNTNLALKLCNCDGYIYCTLYDKFYNYLPSRPGLMIDDSIYNKYKDICYRLRDKQPK